MAAIAETLRRAADLTHRYGPNPERCIRAAVYGRPDVQLPFHDTDKSLLVEDTCYWLQQHINPGITDADYMDTIGEWVVGRSIADVRAVLIHTAENLPAGAQ